MCMCYTLSEYCIGYTRAAHVDYFLCRAKIEDEYAKSLLKLSKASLISNIQFAIEFISISF